VLLNGISEATGWAVAEGRERELEDGFASSSSEMARTE
jgi:hypothetical protein